MQTQASARRVRVKDRRGIYYREGADGKRRYEIGYRDSDGRQRWQTVAGDLKDAEAAREDVRGRLRRGERVTRSRATLTEVTEQWLPTQTQLRPRTLEIYSSHLRIHILPRLGRLRITEINEDDVARLIGEMQANDYAAWTIRGVLTPLSRVLGHAARRGMIASNPVKRLERGERPKVEHREMRILAREEIPALLAGADASYRPLLATAVFTGLRIGELLGLTWGDVDFAAGTVRVSKQLDRAGRRVDPKTPQAKRAVVLMPALGRLLREQKLAAPRSRDADFVFATAIGTPLDRTNATRRGLKPALRRAGLVRKGSAGLRFHDLRHTFASLLIARTSTRPPTPGGYPAEFAISSRVPPWYPTPHDCGSRARSRERVASRPTPGPRHGCGCTARHAGQPRSRERFKRDPRQAMRPTRFANGF